MQSLERRFESISVKAVVITTLTVLMLWPLSRVESLISERQNLHRAVRYGILFVAITFACFFAWEHLVRGMRLHPMQYLLVGLALATFYLLLLALSEHIGFAMSYALAAGALVALITAYISGATNNHPAVQ
jgi:inner membrane protein involved in colicin E2 resistance